MGKGLEAVQQRRHPRRPARQRCWCEGDDIGIYGEIENWSEGGLFVRTSAPLPRGARVRLRIRAGDAQVSAAASVVWRRTSSAEGGAEAGMGLRLEGLDERSAALLAELLSRPPVRGA